MSRRSVHVLVAFGALLVGVFLVWQPVFGAETGRACTLGSCRPAYSSLREWGGVLVHGALLALIYLRYLADRKPVH